MTHSKLSQFRTVWFVDFEFRALPGERPKAVCLVARELHSNKLIRQWLTEDVSHEPPFDIGSDSLLVRNWDVVWHWVGLCQALCWTCMWSFGR
jgi:hypothetical protein